MDKIPQQPSVRLDQTHAVNCSNCQGNLFTEGFLLRKASRLLTGGAKDSIIPIPVVYCVKCGSVNKDIMDPEVNSILDPKESNVSL